MSEISEKNVCKKEKNRRTRYLEQELQKFKTKKNSESWNNLKIYMINFLVNLIIK